MGSLFHADLSMVDLLTLGLGHSHGFSDTRGHFCALVMSPPALAGVRYIVFRQCYVHTCLCDVRNQGLTGAFVYFGHISSLCVWMIGCFIPGT